MSTATQNPTEYSPLTSPITSAPDLTARMAAIQDVAIVLSPLTGVSDFPAGWRVSERYVFAQWDSFEKSGKTYLRGDVYKPSWAQGDHAAPTSQLLNKIWSSAGGSILFLRRVDDRKDPHICEVEGQLELRQLDSNLQKIPADKRLDLSGGSEATKAMRSDAQRSQARQRIHELTMTEAFSRGIRKALAMGQSYSMADLKTKPFVVYACVPDFDMSDKMTRAMVVASQLGCVEQLFGVSGGAGQKLLSSGTIDTPNGATVNAATGELVEPAAASAGYDDLPPDEPSPSTPEAVCEHSCGCQVEIPKADAEKSLEKLHIALCEPCFPGRQFDYGRHASMTTLGYPPPYDKLTPAKARDHAKNLAAKGGA